MHRRRRPRRPARPRAARSRRGRARCRDRRGPAPRRSPSVISSGASTSGPDARRQPGRPARAARAGRPARSSRRPGRPPVGSRVWTTTTREAQPDEPGDGDGGGCGRRRARGAATTGARRRPAPPGKACEQGDHGSTLARTSGRIVGARAGDAPLEHRRREITGPPVDRPSVRRSRGAPSQAAGDRGRRRVRRAASAAASRGRGRRATAVNTATAVRRGGSTAAGAVGEPGAGGLPLRWRPSPAPAGSPTGRHRSVPRSAPDGCAVPAAGRGRRPARSRAPRPVPSSAQTEKPAPKVSIQANSVSRKPSPARPTVTHERGKLTGDVVERPATPPTRPPAGRARRRSWTVPELNPLRL